MPDMTVKRTKVTDGLFTSERVTFDLTQPMDEKTWAEFRRVADGSSIMARIAQLEAYTATYAKPQPAVALRLDKMQAALAIAKRGGRRDEVFIAMESAELWRREIEILRDVVPKAAMGIRHSKAQSKRRRDKPGTDSYATNRNAKLRAYHARLVKDHQRDATAQTAAAFGLGARQVRRIVGKG